MSEFETIEPLSNFQIIEKCEELQIKNFKGVFMRDELQNKKATPNECMVINTDHSSNEGTHWTCLFINNGSSFYFDPYGFKPTVEVERYCTSGSSSSSKNSRYYSPFPIQKMNEVICGHYCIYVLYRINNDIEFYDVCNELMI